MEFEGFVSATNLILLTGDDESRATYLAETLEVALSFKSRLSQEYIVAKTDTHVADAGNQFVVGSTQRMQGSLYRRSAKSLEGTGGEFNCRALSSGLVYRVGPRGRGNEHECFNPVGGLPCDLARHVSAEGETDYHGALGSFRNRAAGHLSNAVILADIGVYDGTKIFQLSLERSP